MINPLYIAIGGVLVLLAATGVGSRDSIIDAAIGAIVPWEGFSATPYWDVRQWSIGYGTRIGTDRNSKPAVTWTESQARAALADIVQDDYNQLRQLVTRPLTDNQWIALLDFAYNMGITGTAQIIDRINNGTSAAGVADALKLYTFSDGEHSQVLVNRREFESNLFLS